MAALSTHLPFLLLTLLFHAASHPLVPILPVSKHRLSRQYVARIYQGTTLLPVDAVLHLGGPLLWLGCDSGHASPSYRRLPCNSTQCPSARASRDRPPRCGGATCNVPVRNVLTGKSAVGNMGEDALGVSAADGSVVSVPRFVFPCVRGGEVLEGLAGGATGMAGLAHGPVGLLTQLSAALNFTRKFAICLPSSSAPGSGGVVFFGGGPYLLLPNIDVSKVLIRTPLVVRASGPTAFAKAPSSSFDYIFRVQSIRINGERILLNSPLPMETKISTIDPYATLETSIYESVVDRFVREAVAANATRVASVPPFDVCFNTKVGEASASLPIIDLMLDDDEVFWRIFDTNSMVEFGEDVACLGFLDAGRNPRTPIVMGGHQLEDNLIQFDLDLSRLGFTSSLLLEQTSCADFNFAAGP